MNCGAESLDHRVTLPSLRWQRFLIELPARIVDLWFRVYVTLLAIAGLVTVTMIVIVLLLALFGIRWGW